MGFLIKKVAQQIVTAKVSLTQTDLNTAGFIYDIPEYPAVPGYFWNTLFMNGEIQNNFGITPYVGTTNIHIQASNAPNYQLRFGAAFMSQPIFTWHTTVVTTILGQVYQRNDKLQIHNVNGLTVGDTNLNIYIGAILQQY
jgi:hypothetical protein